MTHYPTRAELDPARHTLYALADTLDRVGLLDALAQLSLFTACLVLENLDDVPGLPPPPTDPEPHTTAAAALRAYAAELDASGFATARSYTSGTTTSRYTATTNALGLATGLAGPNVATSLAYDASGLPLTEDTTADSVRRVVSSRWTKEGLLQERTYPDGTKITYTHDAAGQVKQISSAGVVQSKYTYDLDGRVIKAEYANGITQTRQYDGAGQLLKVTSAKGAQVVSLDEVTRDVAGRPTRIREQRLGQPDRNLFPIYDAAGRLAAVCADAACSSKIHSYEYDPAGNITRQTSENVTTSYGIRPGTDLVTQTTKSIGLVPAGGMVKIRVGAANQTVMGNLTVTDAQERGYTTAWDCSPNMPITSLNNYQAKQNSPNFAAVKATADGDICIFTSATAHLIWDQSIQTNNPAAQVAVRKLDTRVSTSTPATSDGRGRTTALDGTTFTWDERDRIAAVDKSGQQTTYRYDINGNPLSSTTAGVTTHFTWEQTGPLPRLLSEKSGSETTNYIYGPLGPELVKNGQGFGTLSHDFRGSVVAYSSGRGDTTSMWRYAPYGDRTASIPAGGGTTAMSLGFEGEFQSGSLVHLRARTLDASSGRFLSIDPAWATSLAAFSYAGATPFYHSDPSGMWCAFGRSGDGNCRGSGWIHDAAKTLSTVAGGVAVTAWVVAGGCTLATAGTCALIAVPLASIASYVSMGSGVVAYLTEDHQGVSETLVDTTLVVVDVLGVTKIAKIGGNLLGWGTPFAGANPRHLAAADDFASFGLNGLTSIGGK